MAQRGTRGGPRYGMTADELAQERAANNAAMAARGVGAAAAGEAGEAEGAGAAVAEVAPKLPFSRWKLTQLRRPGLTNDQWKDLYNHYVSRGGRRTYRNRKSRRNKSSRRHR